MAVLGVAAYGGYAYLNTPIEAYPDVTNVQVNVIAQLPGLAPEEIERQVTIPLERVLNGTPGMMSMRSESLFGLSLVWLAFEDRVESFRARALISQRLAGAELPEGTHVELAPDATPLGKIFYYLLVSDRHSSEELRSEQEWNVVRWLRQIGGVAEVVTRGGYLKEIHVEVCPLKLEVHDLVLHDVTDAIEQSNINVGGGFLTRGDQWLVVRGIGYMVSAEDVKNVVLTTHNGTPVTVADVSRVVRSHTPRQGTVGFNDDRDVVLGTAIMRRGENPSEVLAEIREVVAHLNDNVLPEGMRIETFYDRGRLVGLTLHTVHTNLLHGALLCIFVVWLFLRSIRGSLIVTVMIPLSLVAAFIGLYALGLPANLISMGAVDFGMFVDGAVILTENVISHLRTKRPESRKEVLKAVASSTLAVAKPTFFAIAIIIAALIPVFTLESVEGRIFRPLAITYSFALVGCLIFALTVVPALCALFMRAKDGDVPDPKVPLLLRSGYSKVLGVFYHRPYLPIIGVLVMFVSAGSLATRLGTEFIPELDEGDIEIFTEMHSSVSKETGREILDHTRALLLQFPEVISVVSKQGRPEDGTDNEGINMAQVMLRVKEERDWRPGLTKDRLEEEMRDALAAIPGVSYHFSAPIRDEVEEAITGVRGKVVLKIFGEDLVAMRETLFEAVELLGHIPGVIDLDIYRDSNVPQLQIRLDRHALAREGITVETAQTAVQTALAGSVVTTLWEGERMVPVRVRLPAEERIDPARIGAMVVPTMSGARVALRDIADIDIAMGRSFIPREGNSRYLALKFDVAGGFDLGSVINEAREVVERELAVPEDHFLVWAGEFENQERALARLKLIVPVSLLVVVALLYTALASFRGALAILLMAPFGMTGGIFALRVAAIPISVSAAIGFIALLGQVALTGLLIISAINERLKEGLSMERACIEGAASRFRAFLMIVPTTMVGLLPMAVSTGVGSEIQRPFAVVIIGGMVTAFMMSLFLLPVVYRFLRPKNLGEWDELA